MSGQPVPSPSVHEEPAAADDGAGADRHGGRSTALDDLVAVLGTYVALGVLGALLWWALCDTATFTVTDNGDLAMGEVELAKRFNPDAWYAVIAAVLGLLSGAVVAWWRSRDPLRTSLLLLVGSGVAAAVMAVLGGWLGPDDPRQLVSTAEAGARLAASLSVDAAAVYLVWPVMTLIGALVVLWSPPPPE